MDKQKTEYTCFCGGAVKKNALGYWQCDKCNFACTDDDPEPVIEEGKRIRAQEGKKENKWEPAELLPQEKTYGYKAMATGSPVLPKFKREA
ncbi:MAG: hypothetical protein WC374_04665 [Phycisphaerae bacterium]|jgi:hypothetical protein